MTPEEEHSLWLRMVGFDGAEELGMKLRALDKAFRNVTETRPYVYEVRFDLWPPGQAMARAIIKGFGADGPLIAFHDTSGLVGAVGELADRALNGKLYFTEDNYPPKNYEQRKNSWVSHMEYLEKTFKK